MNNSLDDRIHENQPVTLAHIDINVMVTPGHDMVVNHVDGSQEVAQGHVAVAVMAKEAKTGEVVSPAEVDAQSTETPRTPDPEVNGKDQQAVAPVTPTAPDTPEAPAEDAPAEDASDSTSQESSTEETPVDEPDETDAGQEAETPAK